MTYLSGRKEVEKTSKRTTAILNLIAILGLITLLAVFLIEYNTLVGKNYELRRLQNLFLEQQALTKKLEIRLMEMNSINNLQTISQSLNLVAIDKIKYLESIQASVALFSSERVK